MTLIRDVLARDITGWEIPNLGVAKVGPPQDESQWRILRHELESFVADGEYGAGLDRMLSSYFRFLDKDSQPAAWVSGFYGSGKSHLVRVLDALWADRELPDGVRAAGLVQLPEPIRDHLKELDSRSRQYGGRFAAAGTLNASGTSVGLAILSIVFAAAGLPEELAQARLVLWLRKEGLEGDVIEHVEAHDRSFKDELTDLYVSEPLAEAILAARPGMANSVADMLQLLRAEYPSVQAVPDHTFMEVLERTLRSMSPSGDIPLSLIVLDECQQFIGESLDRAHDVQVLVEAMSAQLGSRVMVVATGQMALRATPTLQKLIDRFGVEVSLRDKDVDQVIRSVVLRKRPERTKELNEVLDRVSGEIDRELAGSPVGPVAADKVDLVADYPLLPARRRLWERILRALDTSGRSGQLRTQLRLVVDATKAVAGRELGVAVAIDRVYDDQESGLQQSGALPQTTAQLIAGLDDGTDEGRLGSRVAKVVYLLNRLPKDGPLSAGLRATSDVIADLLIEDLRTDGARLRERVPQVISSLVKRSVLQELDGGAYILQTPEGAEWDAEFQAHQSALAEDSRWLAERRDQLLREAFGEIERTLRPRQGQSKIGRKAKAYYGGDQPSTTGPEVPIWVRDEWSATLRTVRDDAQQLADDSPLVLVWIPKERADALKAAMVEGEAANRTVDRRAVPSTQEGRDARQGLLTRRDGAWSAEKSLASRIVSVGRVFQAGGNELEGSTQSGGVAALLTQAVDNAVLRLYTGFGPADYPNWEAVLKRIREGASEPLAPIGHRGEVDDHPAGKQVLAFLGAAGKRGTEVRKKFEAPEYGWSQDAVDAILLALCATGKVVGRYNGNPIDPTKIPQNQMGSGDYRADEVPFTATDRAKLKGLAQGIGIAPAGLGDAEVARAVLSKLRELADAAGGEAPLPSRPSLESIREIEGLSGNAQLSALSNAKEDLLALGEDWKALASRIPERRKSWDRTQRLARHAAGLPGAPDFDAQLAAIELSRSLLDDPDQVGPIATGLADAIRAQVANKIAAFEAARTEALDLIKANPGWTAISSTEQTRILADAGLGPRAGDAVGTLDELLETLDRVPLASWTYRIDAVQAQVTRVFQELQGLTTKAPVPVALPKAVVTGMADLERYFDDVRKVVQPHFDRDETVAL